MIHKILTWILFLIILVAGMSLAATVSALYTDYYTTGLWNEYVEAEVRKAKIEGVEYADIEIIKAKETAFINGYYMAGYTWCMFDLANNGKSPWVYSNPNAQEYCITFERTLFLEETHKMTPPMGYDVGKIKRGGRTG